MLAGIILIIAGLVIAIYPPLLAWIIAFLLMVVGALTIAVAFENRKLARHYENPFIEIFFRF